MQITYLIENFLLVLLVFQSFMSNSFSSLFCLFFLFYYLKDAVLIVFSPIFSFSISKIFDCWLLREFFLIQNNLLHNLCRFH